MKNIIVKKTKNNKYLIYVSLDNVNIACEMANNESERIMAVNTFLLLHFEDCTNYDVKDIVKEITL